MFGKKVGKVEVRAYDGSPVLFDVTCPHGGHSLRLSGLSEIRDLQYAVNSAVEYAEAYEAEMRISRLGNA